MTPSNRAIHSRPLAVLAMTLLATACGSQPSEAPGAEPPAAEPPPVAEVKQAAPAEEPVAPAETTGVEAPAAEMEAAEPAAATPSAEAEPAPATGAEAEAPSPAASPAAQPEPGTFRVASGSASFLIDAPLEKIKGSWSRVGGSLEIDPADLTKTRGRVTVDVSSLKTHTFGIPDKDARQGGHALNWMEVGSEVDAATRARYSTATFTVDRVERAAPSALEAGKLRVKATVRGTLSLHGKTSKHSVDVEVTFDGPANAPTGASIRTAAPFPVSLEHHDIKPRDLTGRFLAGALEKIGQKITDAALVNLELRAKRK